MAVRSNRKYDVEKATADDEKPVSAIKSNKAKLFCYITLLLISILAFMIMLACGTAGVAASLYGVSYGEIPYLYHIGTTGCVLILTVFETTTIMLFFNVDQVREHKLLTFKTKNWTTASYSCLILKVLIAVLLINTAFAVSFVGLTMVYNYPNVTSSVGYFIGVELLLGFAVPLLCLLSAWMTLVIIHSVALKKLDVVRSLVMRIFSSIHYDEEGGWWVIADYFYISKNVRNPCQCCTRQSNKRGNQESKGKPMTNRTAKQQYDCDCPTILIFLILSLTFFIAVSYFVNAGIIQQNNFNSCSNVTRDYLESGIPCLSFRQRDIIDCTSQSATTGPVLCIQFVPFKNSVTTLTILTSTGVLFIITVEALELLFFVLKVLYKLYMHNLWLLLTLLLACISFVCCIILVIFIYVLNWNHDLLFVLQVAVACVDMMLAVWLVLLKDPEEMDKRNNPESGTNDESQVKDKPVGIPETEV